jgi:hypothetical protein
MFTINDVSVYILNWKKVTHNSVKLEQNIKKIISDVTIINCDEFFNFGNGVKAIQLDDSHYYGSQYEHAIRNAKENNIFCVIVGDNIAENNFEAIFINTVNMFNKYKVGIYAPNDKRSPHKNIKGLLEENVYHIENPDCGFWCINPEIVKKMKTINYGSISPMGWGIDVITVMEAHRLDYIVIRDYKVETDQLDHTTNYNTSRAQGGLHALIHEYKNKYMKILASPDIG